MKKKKTYSRSHENTHNKQNLFNFVWPNERDILERPDRYRYVRKLIKTNSCVFCDASSKGVSFESLVVFKNSLAMVVLNKFPYNTGHTLVLPIRHCGDLVDLSAQEYQAWVELLRQTALLLRQSYGCPGLNIGLNHGDIAGAGIPGHLHWHVVPRWYGDTNFFPVIAETKVISETLEQTYDRVHSLFKECK